MKPLPVLTFVVVAAMATGFSGDEDPRELAAIASEGRELVRRHPGFGLLAAHRWPPAIARRHPERVYLTPAGLYMATNTFFVEEAGLFVPDPESAAPDANGSDPVYRRLADGLFAYEIKG